MEINQISNSSLKENMHKLLAICGSTTKEGIDKLIHILHNFRSLYLIFITFHFIFVV